VPTNQPASRAARVAPWAAAALALVVLGHAGVAAAGCTVPFTISTPASLPALTNDRVACVGPWVRNSDDHPVTAGLDKERFYCADQTFFSMWGTWDCFVNWDGPGGRGQQDVQFCVESTGPAEVDLSFDGAGLTVNATDSCDQAEASSFLEDGARGAGGRTDRDAFDFPGKAGERVRVVLDRDGTAGGEGDTATLALASRAGQELARRTGKVPLKLDATLADAGLVVRVVPADGAGAFRGGYKLAVRPRSTQIAGRLLRPLANVEP
jgi:hypothetical protein